MKTFYFEDFAPGTRIESPGTEMTREAILAFAERFDPQPFHTDIRAAEASMYGGLIASGIHTIAVSFSLLLRTGALANNLGSPGFDELRWLRPVRPGDTLRAVAEVVDVRPSASRPDRGTVRFRCTTLNQKDEPVQTVYCNQLIRRRPAGIESATDLKTQ
jgi:acyl dehydratase